MNEFIHSFLINILCVFFFFCCVGSAEQGDASRPQGAALYTPMGKRDPFLVPDSMFSDKRNFGQNPLLKYQLDRYKLRGILKGLGKSRAMFEDPVGISHIVTEGDLIGIEKAQVSRIIDSEVILTEKSVNYLGKESLLEKVLSLPKDRDDGVVDYVDTPAKRTTATEGNP
jgi:Tfp pilus assembly protein PilP